MVGISGMLDPVSGVIVASFGNTGDVMSGNRLKYTLLGYETFFGIAMIGALAALLLMRTARGLSQVNAEKGKELH
jgi:hypothetical protein